MKPCGRDIKILLAYQQDVLTYAGNLMYGVRLQVNARDRLAKKSLKKMNFVSDGHFKERCLNFHISIASIKSNYDDIFSFTKKLKFGDSNICTKFMIRKQKIINNCPSDTSISLRSYVSMLKYFALLKYGRNLQIF